MYHFFLNFIEMWSTYDEACLLRKKKKKEWGATDLNNWPKNNWPKIM